MLKSFIPSNIRWRKLTTADQEPSTSLETLGFDLGTDGAGGSQDAQKYDQEFRFRTNFIENKLISQILNL